MTAISNIYFEMHHLDRFAIIEEPCTMRIRNHTNLKWDNLYEDDGHSRWIVNLKAITAENLATVKLAVEKSSLHYYDVSKYFLTGALWETQVQTVDELPIKGEEVGCVFDYVDGVLRCTNLSIIPRKRPKIYIHSIEVQQELTDLEAIINGLKDE
jgi:hypothetical protein